LFVHQSRFDEVVDGVAEIAKSIKLGAGLEAGTQMGTLVSEEQHLQGTRPGQEAPGRHGLD
jgi:phenylacetaldehyde dehydrogenase